MCVRTARAADRDFLLIMYSNYLRVSQKLLPFYILIFPRIIPGINYSTYIVVGVFVFGRILLNILYYSYLRQLSCRRFAYTTYIGFCDYLGHAMSGAEAASARQPAAAKPLPIVFGILPVCAVRVVRTTFSSMYISYFRNPH